MAGEGENVFAHFSAFISAGKCLQTWKFLGGMQRSGLQVFDLHISADPGVISATLLALSTIRSEPLVQSSEQGLCIAGCGPTLPLPPPKSKLRNSLK